MIAPNWKENIRALEQTIETLLEREHQRNQPARLLVVDDEPNDVALLLRVLDRFNCAVTTCRNAEEAEEQLARDKFDYVFLDQKMPCITGLEILRRTLPANANTQFFIVSGFLDSQVINEALRLSAMFLAKPVRPEALSFFLEPKPEPDA